MNAPSSCSQPSAPELCVLPPAPSPRRYTLALGCAFVDPADCGGESCVRLVGLSAGVGGRAGTAGAAGAAGAAATSCSKAATNVWRDDCCSRDHNARADECATSASVSLPTSSKPESSLISRNR